MRSKGLVIFLLALADLVQAELHFDCAEVFRSVNESLLTQFNAAGIAAQCHYLPHARGAQQIAAGELDGALLRTDSFGKAFPALLRVEPAAHQMMLVLYRRTGAAIDATNWREHSIVTLRGTVVLDQMLAGLDVERVNTLAAGLKQLSAGRAEVLVGDRHAVPELMDALSIGNIEMVYPPLATQLLYIYLRPEQSHQAERISAVLLQEHTR